MEEKTGNNIPSARQPEASSFTRESNKSQSYLLGRATLETVDRPDYPEKGNCVIESEEKDTGHTKIVWSQEEFEFLEKEYISQVNGERRIEDTVHPSLWNNGKNNHLNGVFPVHPAMPIFQVRGYDMANITFVYTGSQWLIFDTLMSGECTRAAVDLLNEYLDKKLNVALLPGQAAYNRVGRGKIAAVIVSHSHIDHYGGLHTLRDIHEGDLTIYAPKGFEQHAVSENLYAGVAMGRRASFQYGTSLDAGCCGRVSIGIGQGQSKGTVGYLRPTYEVDEEFMNQADNLFRGSKETGRRYLVYGHVRLYFQLTPGTEAPAEMNNYLEFYDGEEEALGETDSLPAHRALWMAENCNGTLHNLYTLRGAQVRDAKAWSDFLMQTLSLWPDAEVVFQAHNWPRKGNDTVKDYLFRTAAAYKYLNDQCLLYMNQGYKPDEIAEKVRLPKPLECTPYLRPYYGTLKHNARAVYQRYLGWYDANPVHLDPLPEEEGAVHYVRFMQEAADGIDKQIREEYDRGNYRFVADLCYRLLLGKASGSDTYRSYLADSLQQLGYMAESGIWRNSYLSGAKEVRDGGPLPATAPSPSPGEPVKMPENSMMRHMSYEMLLDYLGIVLDTDKASALGAEALWSGNTTTATTDFYLEITSRNEAPQTAWFHIWATYGVLLYQKVSQEQVESSRLCGLTSEDLYTLIANIGNNGAIRKVIDSLKGEKNNSRSLLQAVFCYMVNINRYAGFDIMQPCNRRYGEQVKACAGMLDNRYDSIGECRFDTGFTLTDEEKAVWQENGCPLVEAGVIDDLYFFSEIPTEEYQTTGYDKTFYKYQYCETLYECYKYLAGHYVPDADTQFVKFCIDMAEPYVNRFRRKPGEGPTGRGGAFYPFDEEDMRAWQTYCVPIFTAPETDSAIKEIYQKNRLFFQPGSGDSENAGIGPDGKFYGSELLHFLYLCYRYLYEHRSY